MSNENIIRILEKMINKEKKDTRNYLLWIIFSTLGCLWCSFEAKNTTGFYSLFDAFISGFIFSHLINICVIYIQTIKSISRMRKDLDELRTSSLQS